MDRLAWCRRAAAVAAVCLLAAASLSCGARTGPDTLEQAHALFDRMQFAEALPLAKAYLAGHPDDASAHWLLGACYRNSAPSWLTVAEGEFATALALFEASGRRGGLRRFGSDEAFVMQVHRGRALVGMQWMLEAMDRGMQPLYVGRLAEEALRHVERALEYAPDDPELAGMRETLRDLLDRRDRPPVYEPGGLLV